MTSHQDQIQSLIADIDDLLAKTDVLQSWFRSRDTAQSRQVLKRIRTYLVSLLSVVVDENPNATAGTKLAESSHPFQYQPPGADSQDLASAPDNGRANLEPIVQALVQQVGNQFSQFMQPLQADVQALMSQRQALVKEIKQLERQRQHDYSLAQQQANQQQIISEFVQVLMVRLQDNLTQQVSQTLANLEAQFLEFGAANAASSSANIVKPTEHSRARLEQLRLLQREFEQRLRSLDSTVNVVFETLQRNIQSYQESLSGSLEKMHSYGAQGELMFATLVKAMVQQLEQQAEAGVPALPPPLEYPQDRTPPEVSSNLQGDNSELIVKLELPYPGIELPPLSAGTETPEESPPDLDLMLQQLGADSSTATEGQTPEASTPQQSRENSQQNRDDVDELYESLFGQSDGATDVTNEVPVSLTDEASATIDALFAGLADPAIASESTSQPEPTPVEQSLEALLFGEDSDAVGMELGDSAAAVGGDDLPVEVASTPQLQIQSDSTEAAADTITSLTDLIEDTTLSQEPVAAVPDNAVPVNENANTEALSTPPTHSYISASPREDLLGTTESADPSAPDLLLDSETLQQLSEDLLNLENSEIASLPTTPEQPSTDPSRAKTPESDVEPDSPQPQVLDSTTDATEKKKAIVEKQAEAQKNAESKTSPDSWLLTPNSWYLGIDFGTTGLSAALLNRSTCELYPLHWLVREYADATATTRSFRLPSIAYLPPTSKDSYTTTDAQAAVDGEAISSGYLESSSTRSGQEPLNQVATVSAPVTVSDSSNPGLLIQHLKPYLNIGIPYYSPTTDNWEPVLQLSDQQTVSLSVCTFAVSTLLATLNSAQTIGVDLALTVAANGLAPETLQVVLRSVAGAIFSCPTGWSEQYRFNLREAVLDAQLVARPEQVFFVEEAIAALLSQLPPSKDRAVLLPGRSSQKRIKASADWRGGTLVINGGATTTELALVDLPADPQDLTYGDFGLHSFNCAGNTIDQDIICQLLCPVIWRQPRRDRSSDTEWSVKDGWSWHSHLPDLDEMCWDSLKLEQLELPLPGKSDQQRRLRLQQRLENSLLGQALLEAARHLKLILQHEEVFTLALADQQWCLRRRDFESRVVLPFVQRLNRELNVLLVTKGIPMQAIAQVVCTGGTASLNAIARWLRQKLPNATIIQDLYRSDRPLACSRVAYGLAMLPFYPQVLDGNRQQYNDYFLLSELLRAVVPDKSISLGEVTTLMECRGINTRACQHRLLAMLEGYLPLGLVPSSPDEGWLTPESRQNPDYTALKQAPLFHKEANFVYRPDAQQINRLQQYLNTVLAGTHQSLEEPYLVNL